MFNADDLITTLTTLAATYGLRILAAIALFIVGRWIARLVARGAERVMKRSAVDAMLVSFAGNVLYYLLFVLVVLAALTVIGIPTTSAVAVVGAAGLAVGFALQDSLSNFAAGVMIIFFKPFKVGDAVEVAGEMGMVEKVQLFTTTLASPDNKEVIVPNGSIISGNIINYSAKPIRRVDLVFGIGYDDDLRQARTLLEQILRDDPRVLADPAPTVAVGELADSSVNFVVRPYVKTADYWAATFAITEQVKLRFDEAGISIPYPQQDVYLHQAAA